MNLQRAAEAASQAKTDFLASMSHELRTPMNAVLGAADLLGRTQLTDEQREHVDMLANGGSILMQVLNDVLDLAKIEAGKLEIQHEDADPGQIVAGVCATIQSMAREKALKLGFAIEPTAAGVWRLDAMRVRQVLANLVSNAVKFTADGQVSVRVWTSTRGLEFSVLDTGAGIPADRLADLFGKFNQLDASTTRQFGGTGLGLAICRRLCALLGGRVEAESTEGVGSTFSVWLPRIAAPQHEVATADDETPLTAVTAGVA